MKEVYYELNNLLVYRNLVADDVVQRLQGLSADDKCDEFEIASKLIAWAENAGAQGNITVNYLLGLIACSENTFSSMAEKTGGKVTGGLLKAAVHDVAILKGFLRTVCNRLFRQEIESIILDYTPACACTAKLRKRELLKDVFLDVTQKYTDEQVAAVLADYYSRYGCGRLSGYGAFKWDSSKRELVGIEHIDQVQLSDIIGYDYQKSELIRNTEAFIKGRPANNVLLVGARGTGKSSSVKAVANRYYEQGLRLIEISKSDLKHLGEIMASLRTWGKKFILFLDDLSFEEYEADYKVLKSLIDGGMEVRPDNVLIYATSNRRNLVKETWEERGGSELHRQDTINEKISLADRFGVTLFYTLPNQEEYFKMVEEIARKNSILLSPAELRSAALRWEMSHTGRSGRTARQLVDYLAGEIAN